MLEGTILRSDGGGGGKKPTLKTITQAFQVGKLNQSISQFSHSVMSHSATPWTAAHQTALSVTNSWSSPKPMSISWMIPSSQRYQVGQNVHLGFPTRCYRKTWVKFLASPVPSGGWELRWHPWILTRGEHRLAISCSHCAQSWSGVTQPLRENVCHQIRPPGESGRTQWMQFVPSRSAVLFGRNHWHACPPHPGVHPPQSLTGDTEGAEGAADGAFTAWLLRSELNLGTANKSQRKSLKN